MDSNREKQIKDPHITQFADEKPGPGSLHVVIMPASLTVDQQHKPLKDNIISENTMSYPSHSTGIQPRAKPVRLVLMPAPSKANQKHPCTSITKQSERELLLLPHSVIKQPKIAFSQSDLTNQPPKKVQVLPVVKDRTQGVEYYTDDHVDISDSQSVLKTSEDDQPCSMPNSLGGTDVEALQKSHFASKQNDVPSVCPVQEALLSKAQQCENINASKGSRLKKDVSDHPNSRPGMVPPHLIVMTASSKEINYRIKSFLARKQAELDIQNVEEYCLHIGINANVCARVDATVHQHRKQKKRKFEFAPQPEEKLDSTHFMSKDASQERLPLSVAHPILEERIGNAEEHIRLWKPVPRGIYRRLKSIEDRILQLEGMSPEYTYDAAVNLHPPRPLPKIKRRCSMDELDAKIAELRNKFEKKPDASIKKP